MTKWVAVTDSYKPYYRSKKHRPVIVTDGNWVTLAWYDHEKDSWLQDISFKDITNAVLGWHYLPNPWPHKPKKSKEKKQDADLNAEVFYND